MQYTMLQRAEHQASTSRCFPTSNARNNEMKAPVVGSSEPTSDINKPGQNVSIKRSESQRKYNDVGYK